MAAAKLVAEARTRAAGRWAVPETDVTYADGALASAGRRVTLAELAAEQRLAAGASFTVAKLTYAGCAVGVIVDVDPETGIVELVHVVVGADVGRAVNPALVDAQLVGGVAFGIGNTLHERRSPYDAAGQLLSGTLMDYALPSRASISRPSTPSTRRCRRPPIRSASADSANAATRPRRRDRQRGVRDALRERGVAITTLPLTGGVVRARRSSGASPDDGGADGLRSVHGHGGGSGPPTAFLCAPPAAGRAYHTGRHRAHVRADT
jgi:hypothetical protein